MEGTQYFCGTSPAPQPFRAPCRFPAALRRRRQWLRASARPRRLLVFFAKVGTDLVESYKISNNPAIGRNPELATVYWWFDVFPWVGSGPDTSASGANCGFPCSKMKEMNRTTCQVVNMLETKGSTICVLLGSLVGSTCNF